MPEEENSSKSVEIERIMREARLRELVKGVYSTSYEDSVTAKVIKSENIIHHQTYVHFNILLVDLKICQGL